MERDTQSIQSDGIIYALYQDVHDEFLPLLYLNEEYGAALFVTLQYMDIWRGKPEFEQYKAWLGILFKKLVEARTNYTFNRYVEKRSASTENIGYKKFLNFLWNLDLSDMKIILRTYEPHIRN